MPPDLTILEGFGGTRSERRTLRKVGVSATLIVIGGTLVGWIYSREDAISQRVTTLETHRVHDAKDIEEANKKLDFLIERLVR